MANQYSSFPSQTLHAVVEVPIAERNGASLPLLLLGDSASAEPSVFAAAYLRNRQLEGTDVVTLYRHAKALGLLYDFYTLKLESPLLDDKGMQKLIKEFWEARRYGCADLGWTPVSSKTARDDLNAVTEFSDFCSENFGHAHLNPREEVLVSSLSNKDFQAWLAKMARRKMTDLLAHLEPSTKERKGEVNQRRFNPKNSGNGRSNQAAEVKYFPPDRVIDFIKATESLRNRLCWLLLFFGGLRTSELAHLFVGDISFNPIDGSAQVTVADPRDAQMQWVVHGRQRRGTRAAFLLEKYGRVPRTELGTRNPEHAGWKGMNHDEVRRKESTVEWCHPGMGQLFWKIHTEYMRSARLYIGDEHPYYFISLKGDRYGEPMKLSNLRKQFYAAAQRIELSSNTDGVNPHGARHFYGWYCANVLKVSKEKTQKMMHHLSMLSTAVYYNLDKATLRDEIAKAQSRMEKQMPSFLNSDRLLLSTGSDDE